MREHDHYEEMIRACRSGGKVTCAAAARSGGEDLPARSPLAVRAPSTFPGRGRRSAAGWARPRWLLAGSTKPPIGPKRQSGDNAGQRPGLG